jgi:hypothetical protein
MMQWQSLPSGGGEYLDTGGRGVWEVMGGVFRLSLTRARDVYNATRGPMTSQRPPPPPPSPPAEKATAR